MRGARTAGPRVRSRGFTLLEVLAAVAILSIWFLVIAGTAIQALRAEGVSRRRLEAAMIADRTLSDLEASTLDGTVPAETNEISEEGEYTVTVVVRPLVEPAPRGAAPPAPAVVEDGAPPPDLTTLLAGELPARSADLRLLEVEVAWTEGGGEQRVSRTTFAFDLETALAAYEEAGIAIEEAGGAADADAAADDDAQPLDEARE